MKTLKRKPDPFTQARFKIRTAIGTVLVAKEEVEALPEGGAVPREDLLHLLERAEYFLTATHAKTERKGAKR